MSKDLVMLLNDIVAKGLPGYKVISKPIGKVKCGQCDYPKQFAQEYHIQKGKNSIVVSDLMLHALEHHSAKESYLARQPVYGKDWCATQILSRPIAYSNILTFITRT